MSEDLYSKIINPITAEFSQFREYYKSLFTNENAYVNMLLQHFVQNSGKFMRPVLVLLLAKFCGYKSDRELYSLASSFELLHSASLVHDDVVDNSFVRRGNHSVNALYNNKIAVLLGDYVLSLSLEQLHKTQNMSMLREFALLSEKLSEGEILQLNSLTHPTLSEDLYFDIINRKTAYLFGVCAKSVAILSDYDDQLVDKFMNLGLLIGNCFQIKDDIMDIVPSEQMNKTSGNDLKEGKFTLPVIYALNNSDLDWSQTISAIKSCSASDEVLDQVIRYTIDNGGIEYSYSMMQKLKNNAFELLFSINKNAPTDIVEALSAYFDLIIERKY
ncbi:MAG: polyprenyl synthetase family protein [Bacteroidaceae bacterium]|nr:polyprenyl synthetase family protein [Bacteroidaceae bacterium]